MFVCVVIDKTEQERQTSKRKEREKEAEDIIVPKKTCSFTLPNIETDAANAALRKSNMELMDFKSQMAAEKRKDLEFEERLKRILADGKYKLLQRVNLIFCLIN